ncbi:hypothetical protein [Azorhizophilus paspali]|uniref:DUF4435 domain-containing protein n=1 Tax=Azorhizophilus paspali TaxID=69963 RepID=A0ABV6SGJ3_AZOPA
MFRSKQIRTAIVEGVCDKRFLSQWVSAGAPIRFDGFDGKSLVNLAYTKSRMKPYSDFDFLCFFADIDFDVIVKQPLINHPCYIYNAFCFEEDRLYYNDLETYLINTTAFEKVLVNLDVDVNEADSLRKRLERASRVTGSLRAADILVQRANGLRLSVLNGLEIRSFFNSRDITFNEDELFKALPRWSNYREYTDDLIEVAKRLDRELPTDWSLSRGHDLTEMLALYLEHHGQRGMAAEKLELMLRLACERSEFQRSPMGRRLATLGIAAMEPQSKASEG